MTFSQKKTELFQRVFIKELVSWQVDSVRRENFERNLPFGYFLTKEREWSRARHAPKKEQSLDSMSAADEQSLDSMSAADAFLFLMSRKKSNK
jgi:ribonuclease D